MSRLVNIPPLQSVTEVGATTDQATTYTGGLYSDASGGSNAFNFHRGNTVTGVGSGAIGYDNNLGAFDYSLAFGAGNTVAGKGGSVTAAALVVGSGNTTTSHEATGSIFLGTVLGQENVINAYQAQVFGYVNTLASGSVSAAEDVQVATVFGSINTIGKGCTQIVINGTQNSVSPNKSNVVIIGKSNNCAFNNCIVIGEGTLPTADNQCVIGGTTTLYRFNGTFADSETLKFGTGKDATIYYDGTDLVIDPDLVGSGVLKLGASSNNHLQCDKIGLGTTAYSANNVINYSQSGGSRIVLNFQLDFTGTFTNPATIFAETTYSGTGATSSPTNIFSTKQNTQKSGTFSPVIARNGFATGFGVTSAVTIDFNCLTADWNGNGTGHSSGTLRRRGFICSAWGTPTGVGSVTDWGGFTDKDWCLADNTRLYFEGSVNTKGDTYMVYTSASSALDTVVNGTNTLRQTTTLGTWADAFNFAFGTTTGTKIGTATTQKLGFWNVTPVAQYATTGTSTGFTAGAGTNVQDVSTFTGNTGSTAYTIGDIVRALKLCGVMAA